MPRLQNQRQRQGQELCAGYLIFLLSDIPVSSVALPWSMGSGMRGSGVHCGTLAVSQHLWALSYSCGALGKTEEYSGSAVCSMQYPAFVWSTAPGANVVRCSRYFMITTYWNVSWRNIPNQKLFLPRNLSSEPAQLQWQLSSRTGVPLNLFLVHLWDGWSPTIVYL